MSEPQGTKLQLRNHQNTGNRISTYHAVWLLYEILTNRAGEGAFESENVDIVKTRFEYIDMEK